MITKAYVYVLNKAGNGHVLLREVLPDDPYVSGDVERYAHQLAAEWLQAHHPGNWLYRYAKLREGMKLGDAGVLESKYTAGHIDGVTDMSLIRANGFTGQFQTRDFRAGLVPAYVHTDDPERDARYAAKQAEYDRQQAEKRQALLDKLATLPPVQFVEGGEALWQSWIDANQDDYGAATMRYTEYWARLMQAKLADGWTTEYLAKVAERTSHEADVDGITGFMYGAAVSMLSQAWVHGEELRRWHNQQYGHDGDSVVNPALLTIGSAK